MDKLNELLTELRAAGNDLGYTGTGVGTESISFENLRSHFQKVNGIALGILGFLKEPNDYKIVSVSARELTLNQKILTSDYLALRKVEVYKPSAFIGHMHSFLGFMNSQTENIKLVEASLEAFEHTLGRYVMNPEELSKMYTGIKGTRLPSAEKILDEFKEYFLGRSGIDVAPLETIYPNMTSLTKCNSLVLDLTEEFNGLNVQSVRDRADNLYKTLEYLEEALQDAGIEMSKEWRHGIGKQLYTITEWLGVYSLYIAKLVAASVSHRDTITKLNNM